MEGLLRDVSVRFEGFELDPAARSLKRDGKLLSLTPKTLDLLLYLAAHPNQVVGKDELLSAVWPNAYVEESNLSQHVFLLRKALSSAGSSERIVVTVPGKGYQFAAAVEAVPAERPLTGPASAMPEAIDGLLLHTVRSVTSVVVEEESDDTRVELPGRKWRVGRRTLAAGAAALLLIGAGSLLTWRWLRPSASGHIDMVVAPIANGTRDADFDRTLDQALAIDLEQSPYLNLISRSVVQETLAQMQRRADEALTPALAREICQRNNAQVVAEGTLSRLGSRYVLILNANSCVSGKQVAGAKAEAESKEAVLAALDSAASHLRRQLGESTASLERYQTPIAEATTPSFDALLAYTRAGESFRRGDMKGAQLPLERAIALDPNFASAYRIMASSYYNLGDYSQAAAYYKKAFDLRERTTERERLGIEVMYYGYGLNDYEESIRRTRQFLAIYPNVVNSWVSLCYQYGRLGQLSQAIEAGERAMAVDPHSGVAAVELMRAQMRLGRFADAKETARRAMAEGKDHWDIHSMLFQMAFAEGDAAAAKSEGEWGLTHQHAHLALKDLAEAAAAGGQLRKATEEIARAREEARRSGERDFDEDAAMMLAQSQSELGAKANAMATLRSIPGIVGGALGADGDPAAPGTFALLAARNGDAALAEQFLARGEGGASHNTLNNFVYVPLVRGALALESHRPAGAGLAAIQAMEPARSYQLADFMVPYLRAEAETEAGALDAAEADYRLILNNRGVDPISPVYSLAHWKLAQVLAKRERTEEARAEYEAFFHAWKDADADLPPLLAAKREYGQISAGQHGMRVR